MADQGENCVISTKFGPKFVHTADFGTLQMLPL